MILAQKSDRKNEEIFRKNMFKNRSQAGKLLAEVLKPFKGKDLVVIALPRGGVPVAYEVVKELSAPWQPEYAFGAITETGSRIIDETALNNLGVDDETLEAIIQKEEKEIQRRKNIYRQGRSLIDMEGKTIVLVDDGLATGMTARASILSLEELNPQEIIFAVPVAPAGSSSEFLKLCEFVTLHEKKPFYSIGHFYEDFSQLSDDEVLSYLDDLRVLN